MTRKVLYFVSLFIGEKLYYLYEKNAIDKSVYGLTTPLNIRARIYQAYTRSVDDIFQLIKWIVQENSKESDIFFLFLACS